MLTVEIPANKVDKAFKITEDVLLEDVKSDGKSIWYMMYYKLCPKTHVPTYYDHQVIQEPLALKDNP